MLSADLKLTPQWHQHDFLRLSKSPPTKSIYFIILCFVMYGRAATARFSFSSSPRVYVSMMYVHMSDCKHQENVSCVLLGWRLLKAKGTSITPTTTPYSTLHTWPVRMTGQWQSQLDSHPTLRHTHRRHWKKVGERGGKGRRVSWFIWHTAEPEAWEQAAAVDLKSHPKPQPGSDRKNNERKHMVALSHFLSA